MSWERASAHKCADGYFCIGHKVNVVYKKQEDGFYKGMMRIPYCNRCNQICETECIPNQNYRDQTGRGSTKKKKLKPCPEYRCPETGMTIKEMIEDSARKLKKNIQKQQAKSRKEQIEFVRSLIKSGFSSEEIKTVLMAGIKKSGYC